MFYLAFKYMVGSWQNWSAPLNKPVESIDDAQIESVGGGGEIILNGVC